MKINSKGKTIVKESESLKLKAYLCSSKKPTIGWGTTYYPNGKKVSLGDGCNEVQAAEWFNYGLTSAEETVLKLVQVELNENQFSALVSLVYNIGYGQFKTSTILKLLNKGDFEKASAEFPKWRKSEGEISNGLVVRRAKEQALFNLPV